MFTQRAGVLQQQPGVHTVPVKLMEAGQDAQTLVVVEGLQADSTEVRLCALRRVAPGLGLPVRSGLQGRQPLQDILLRQ